MPVCHSYVCIETKTKVYFESSWAISPRLSVCMISLLYMPTSIIFVSSNSNSNSIRSNKAEEARKKWQAASRWHNNERHWYSCCCYCHPRRNASASPSASWGLHQQQQQQAFRRCRCRIHSNRSIPRGSEESTLVVGSLWNASSPPTPSLSRRATCGENSASILGKMATTTTTTIHFPFVICTTANRCNS